MLLTTNHPTVFDRLTTPNNLIIRVPIELVVPITLSGSSISALKDVSGTLYPLSLVTIALGGIAANVLNLYSAPTMATIPTNLVLLILIPPTSPDRDAKEGVE